MDDNSVDTSSNGQKAEPGALPDLAQLAGMAPAPSPAKTHKFDDDLWEGALWVKADPKDCPPAVRSANKKALAGAIVHMIKNTGKCRLRAFGPYAEHKANWSLTIARGILATYSYDLYWYTCVIEAEVNGKTLNGLGYITVFAD